MKDITMCQNGECPVSSTCYRYLAIPTHRWQSYLPEKCTVATEKGCDYYWDVNEVNRGDLNGRTTNIL